MTPHRPQGAIRQLREQLVEARRDHRRETVEEIVTGIRALGARGYRCCVVDYERFRTACYVRLLGFEGDRIKAEVEFPIRPGLRAVQWLPLSHLADYDETEPDQLREIYEELGAYLKRRDASLARQRPRPCGGPALRSSRPPRRLASGPASALSVWWGVAGVLFTCSLVLFIATT
ncbi:MAG: hypothetical protein HN404_08260 [Gemmatimonadetes bacterium]|nr:hypothetical protein [Gemmatimonadota bacterium]